jgi:ribosomal protein S18 acetylase RimI-like enzyme
VSEVVLRRATVDDAAELATFARDAFHAAFGHLYKPEDAEAFYAEHRSEAAYRAALADPVKRVMLAEVDGQLAAYALIALAGMDERPEPRPARAVFLSQLYCAGDATGMGLGARLMDWVLEEARAHGAEALQLSVFSENFGAQRFYQRYGFAKVADIGFWVGSKRDAEFLYEVAL